MSRPSFLKKVLALGLALVLGLSPISAFAEDTAETDPYPKTHIDLDYDTYSKAVYLVETGSGRVIYDENSTARIYPASTTKIMSAALALSLCADPENTMVQVPYDVWAEFEGINISSAGLISGETLRMIDLVYAMLLCSANEAASTVAAHYGRDNFISLMNQKAKELGCKDTHFTNPHGLFDENHYSTAEDLYKITEWALTVPGFADIIDEYAYTMPETDKSYERDILSTVYLQNPYSGYYTSYVKGVKTGTIDESGRCLVSTAEKDGLHFILVIIGAPTDATDLVWEGGNAVFNETRYIYDLAFDKCSIDTVVDSGTPVTSVALRYAAGRDDIILYCDHELQALTNRYSKKDVEITYNVTVPDAVEAPISMGQALGTAEVFADGMKIGDVDLIARETVELDRFSQIMDIMGDIMRSKPVMVIGAILFVVVLLYAYYMLVIVQREKHRAEQRRKKREEMRREQEKQASQRRDPSDRFHY